MGLGNTYTYDAENRIVTATNGSYSDSYVYDAFGHRVRTVVNNQNRDFLYDLQGRNLDEYVPGGSYWLGTWARGEVYAGGMHVATYANGTTQFTQSDWLGTFRVRSDVTGNKIETCTSMPFGEDLNCSTSLSSESTPVHFTGKERDSESGLDNFGARYNASTMGRFMTPDPTMKSVNRLNPQTWNRYAYVVNNPLNRIDPLGLWDISYQDELDKKGHLKHRNIIVSKSKEGDDAASLAKQLGFKGKDAEKLAAQITKQFGDASSMQLSKMGGIVGRTFGVAESGLTEQAKYAAKGGDPTKGPSSLLYNDCSMTCARIASPSNVPMGGEWGIQSTNNLIQQLGLASVNSGDERAGDIIRWGADAKTHFANILFTGDDGITQVFSRSGVNGRFEVVPEQNPSFQSGYGPISGEFRPTD